MECEGGLIDLVKRIEGRGVTIYGIGEDLPNLTPIHQALGLSVHNCRKWGVLWDGPRAKKSS